MVPDKALRTFKEVLAENDELRTDVVRLRSDVERLGADVARLSDENTQLRQVLEASRRAGKRQAAPFSKGTPNEQPKKPGRRAGAAYGKKAHREPPDHVDETVAVGLPKFCECGGCVEEAGSAVQYQEEMPEPKPIVTRFDISFSDDLQSQPDNRLSGRPLDTSYLAIYRRYALGCPPPRPPKSPR